MGISGIGAQVLLLRELLVSFLGNELTLGIILANWLILVAIGSFFIGRSVEKIERKIEVFVLFQLIFSAALPFSIYLARVFKNLLVSTPGEALGFAPIFYSSFLILVPVTLLHGARFTYGCKLYSSPGIEDASPIGKVYFLESAGSIIGGLLMTFLLIQYLNSFEIAFIISLANAIACILLVWPKPAPSKDPIRIVLLVFSVLLSFAFAYCLLPQTSSRIQSSSIQSQWKGLNVIHYENSIYGNITVTKRNEQLTFLANGVPTITAPVPDQAFIEDFVHFPMLFHEKPESILILNGGAGGMIQEILKYPVTAIDYVELDPLLLKLVRRFSTPLTQAELSDPRVKIHYMDGRFFLRNTQNRFDVIFIGLSAPQELQTNRLFSSDFFASAKQKMSPDGIVVLSLPGSLAYVSPELRDLNGSILDTLKSGFQTVRVIPGDVNLYLASNSKQLESVTAADIIKRLEERKIPTKLLNKDYIAYRLHERWTNWFFGSIKGRETRINSDLRPIGVFLSLSYWNALFSPYLSGVFKSFERLSLRISIPFIALITLLAAVLFWRRANLSIIALPYSIFTTGLAGMLFNLAVIFTFQTFYGYVYHQIGLLIALFMFGVASCSLYMTRRLNKESFNPKPRSRNRFGMTEKVEAKRNVMLNWFQHLQEGTFGFLKIEIAVILFSLLFPLVFFLSSRYIQMPALSPFVYAAFLIMAFISGSWIGLQFPLASKIYLVSRGRTLGHTAGLLYGADLLGGFLGGLFGGVLLLPILGLTETCFLIAALKASSLGLLVVMSSQYAVSRRH